MHILLLKELLLFVLIERDRDEMNRQVILKNNAPVISCISKINDALIENAEDLDIVMPMYNLLEYSKNYSKTSGSLWNYYTDKLADETNGDNGPIKMLSTQSLLNIRQALHEVIIMWQLLLETMMQIKKAHTKLKFLCY